MENPAFAGLKAVFVNCSLKSSAEHSHTQKLMDLSKHIMEKEGVDHRTIRLSDYNVPPGVYPDMTEHGAAEDEWPVLFETIAQANILIIGTPIWLGEKSSVAQKFLERLYAMSGKTNEKGQYLFYGKVGGCMVTGNEDGAKHCAMGILYALQHVGYTIPPQADSAWLGEIGPGPSYGDQQWQEKQLTPAAGLENNFTNRNITFMTYNLMHMGKLLHKNEGLPAKGNNSEAWQEGERWQFEAYS